MVENNNSLLNDVKNRFLSLPLSAVEGLEHEPQITDFEFIEELGIGTFGKVDLVSHKITKAKYAIKYIDKTDPENLIERDNFNREVEIMYKLNHPNIVKLFGHFEDEQYCYFIMQYIPNRSVYELIQNDGKKPNIRLIASVMKDLINAVYYLHNMKPMIIHRDIKPENILLDFNSKAYLTDFGWSNYMADNSIRKTVCGSPLYLPPEMVKGSTHDKTADIWCIGVLLFELITGTPPFAGNDIESVAMNILKLNISWPAQMDPDAKDLISKILKLNGKERLPIEQILAHKFFNKYFPNAVKELIKPENQINKTFVVSRDIPPSTGITPKKSISKSPFALAKPDNENENPKAYAANNFSNNDNNNININNNINNNNINNINSNINDNINSNHIDNNNHTNNTINKTNKNNNNYINAKKANVKNNTNSNTINTTTNSNRKRTLLIKNKTSMAPKVNIDISTKNNDKNNKNYIIKKLNNNKIPLYTNHNQNNRKNPSSNSYNKNNYDFKYRTNNDKRESFETKNLIDVPTLNYRNSFRNVGIKNAIKITYNNNNNQHKINTDDHIQNNGTNRATYTAKNPTFNKNNVHTSNINTIGINKSINKSAIEQNQKTYSNTNTNTNTSIKTNNQNNNNYTIKDYNNHNYRRSNVAHNNNTNNSTYYSNNNVNK